jgi:hypothetical protein
MELLQKTKGDQAKLTHLMSNKNSRAIVQAMMPAYLHGDAQGGGYQLKKGEKLTEGERNERGLQAVRREMDALLGVAMNEKEIQTKFKNAMGDTTSKTQVFRNKMEDVADRMSQSLLPALEKLTPKILELTDKFGQAVAWAAENPGKAISAAIVASVARAGIENAVRGGIEHILTGGRSGIGGIPMAGGAGGAAAGRLGAALGMAGGALAIAALTVATIQVGQMLIDTAIEKHRQTENKKVGEDVSDFAFEKSAKRMINEGKEIDEGRLFKRRDALEKQQKDIATRAAALPSKSAFGGESDQVREMREKVAREQKENSERLRAVTEALYALRETMGEGISFKEQPVFRMDKAHALSGGGGPPAYTDMSDAAGWAERDGT